MSSFSLSPPPPPLLASVECGGTSFTVSLSLLSTPTSVLHRFNTPTTTPTETINTCVAYLENFTYVGLGVASFGPLDLNPTSPTYGCISSSSPKKEWRNVNILLPFTSINPHVPYNLDTDVNAPAFAEYNFGGGIERVESSVAYVTVGTGVGVGLVVNGKTVRGLMHPEGGHVCIQKLDRDAFNGYSWGANAPYQGTCTVESFSSSIGILDRLSLSSTSPSSRDALISLSDDDEVWNHVANAVANLCVTLTLLVSVERIVLSGGVMLRTILFDKIRKRTIDLLNGYIDVPALTDDKLLKLFICESTWGNDAGVIGALSLAKVAYDEDNAARAAKVEKRRENMTRISEKGKMKMEEFKRSATLIGGFAAGVAVGAILGIVLARRR